MRTRRALLALGMAAVSVGFRHVDLEHAPPRPIEHPGGPAAACQADGPDWPAPGSRWTLRRVGTGSYGAETGTIVVELLGRRRWQERDVVALREGPITVYVDLAHRLVARVQRSRIVARYQPYEAILAWPLHVGRSWHDEHVAAEAGEGEPRVVTATYRVQALEEIEVPAGRFQAFRIVRADAVERVARWWSPDLGIVVKLRRERSPLHRRGPGVLDEQLVSYEFVAAADP